MGQDAAGREPDALEALRDELARLDAVNQAIGALMVAESRDQFSALHALVVESIRRDVTMYEAARTVVDRYR